MRDDEDMNYSFNLHRTAVLKPTACLLVVSQGGGSGAGSSPQLPLPTAREPADQERAPLHGHGLPLGAACSGLGPDPSQRPQPAVQAKTPKYILMATFLGFKIISD